MCGSDHRRETVSSYGKTVRLVQALDPAVIASVPGLPDLEPIAAEAGERVQAALDVLRLGA